jgi:uncharacterized lipoprotein YmbA
VRPSFARVAAILFCLGLAGCLGGQPVPERTRWALTVERSGFAAPMNAGSVQVGRVRVTAPFERKGFWYRIADDRWREDFYNEFWTPPGTHLRQLALIWLESSEIFTQVAGVADRREVDWWIESRVDGLYADLREVPAGRIVAEFHLIDARSVDLDTVLLKSYDVLVSARSSDPHDLVAAWSAAWTQIMDQVEADLRQVLSERADGVRGEEVPE